MIYVGGTLVLLIFGVMLTAQGPFITMKTDARRVDAGGDRRRLAAGGAAAGRVQRRASGGSCPNQPRSHSRRRADGHAAGHGACWAPASTSSIKPTPTQQAGMSGYLLPFEIVSVHLLVVLIGAAYLARPEEARPPRRTFESNADSRTHGPLLTIMIDLLTEPVGVSHYLVVGAVLFVSGAVCMATKRNALGVLMGIELVLNGANVNFVAFGSEFLQADRVFASGWTARLIALFVIVLAAAEAAVAWPSRSNFYNNHSTVDVDRADELKG